MGRIGMAVSQREFGELVEKTTNRLRLGVEQRNPESCQYSVTLEWSRVEVWNVH